jgi:hypothetical protein
VPYGGSFTTGEILEYPQVLTGLNPPDVLDLLGGVPKGWEVSPGQGESVAPGWKMFETKGGNITGRSIRWGASVREDHPDSWYWTVSSGEGGKVTDIPAGDWEGGPKIYVGDTNGVLNGGTGGDEGGGEGSSGGNPCEASYGGGSKYTLVGCGLGGGGFGGGDPFDGGGNGGGDPDFEFPVAYTAPGIDDQPCYRGSDTVERV